MLEEFRGCIFEEVVAGVGEFEGVCVWEACLESCEEFVGREAPVLHTPDELDGVIFEECKLLFDVCECLVALVCGAEGDILDELMNGDAIFPGVIGCEVAGFGCGCEGFGGGHNECGLGEGIEPLESKFSEERDAAGGDAEGDGGAAEGAGVHEDEALEECWVLCGSAHPDCSAPVMCEECDVVELQVLDEL